MLLTIHPRIQQIPLNGNSAEIPFSRNFGEFGRGEGLWDRLWGGGGGGFRKSSLLVQWNTEVFGVFSG